MRKVKFYVTVKVPVYHPAGVTELNSFMSTLMAIDIIGAARQAKRLADAMGGYVVSLRQDDYAISR